MKNIIITTCICLSIFALVAFNSKRSGKTDADYTIMWGNTTEQLESVVKKKLNEGWVLTGGVTPADGGYLQAMYKNN